MQAESVEAVGIELDRMKCATCGHEQVCDPHQIKAEWNDRMEESKVPHERGCVLPDVRFHALWSALGANASNAVAAFRALQDAYNEPHRAYHDATHIGACLRLLDDPNVRALALHPGEVEAALWYHDAIYDTHARDNEERSACLAEETLGRAGVSREIISRIASHVLATKGHVTDTSDGRLVIDIDLSILGESEDVFDRFERAIRREYAWVEPHAYSAGRSAVLRKFEEREAIYNTPLFRDRYEARARANIVRALEALKKSDR
jgi:predicted metal-dependent HD superfamily phosphohydrolase